MVNPASTLPVPAVWRLAISLVAVSLLSACGEDSNPVQVASNTPSSAVAPSATGPQPSPVQSPLPANVRSPETAALVKSTPAATAIPVEPKRTPTPTAVRIEPTTTPTPGPVATNVPATPQPSAVPSPQPTTGPAPTISETATPDPEQAATSQPLPAQPCVQSSDVCDERDVSDLNPFAVSTGGFGAAYSIPEDGPTVEDTLEKGLRQAGASPVHIAFRGTARRDNRMLWYWRKATKPDPGHLAAPYTPPVEMSPLHILLPAVWVPEVTSPRMPYEAVRQYGECVSDVRCADSHPVRL